ncbi:hypothetical protein [Paenibacillus apiarius]|nr:hypothetical protein [Paenibacillus apiarius]
MPNEGDEKKMSTVMNQKYSQLKVKLDQISKDAKLLKSKAV